MGSYYIGIMSGTSMDGIDSVLVSFDAEKMHLLGTITTDIPSTLKSTLTALCQPIPHHIQTIGETDSALGKLFAANCLALLKQHSINASDVIAIGSHGQTIYHHPNSTHPFTMQIGDPNIIAARTNITTVADFRRRDIALGGQGAPLVPAFHEYLFKRKASDQYVVNIGGMANITYLPSDEKKSITGFDTGPGNTLIDQWYKQCEREHEFDKNGDWARSGKLNTALLTHLLDDPYFAKTPPKSTGREHFNLNWLHQKLQSFGKKSDPVDIQATLTELTAKTIADSIAHTHIRLWVCGGGAYNTYLIERLQAHCSTSTVLSTEAIGIAPQWIEAAAFAWLAKQTIERKPGNCQSVTGAKKATILGGIYPASD